MEKFLAIEQQDISYMQDQKSRQRKQARTQQIANANLTGRRPLRVSAIAKDGIAPAIEKFGIAAVGEANTYSAECVKTSCHEGEASGQWADAEGLSALASVSLCAMRL